MSNLYVDRKHASLELDAGAVLVRVPGERPARLPLAGIERVVVQGEATISARLLGALWQEGAGLLVLAGRKPEPTATLLGRPHGDARLRLAQYALQADRARRLRLATELVRGKVGGAGRLIERALEARPDARRPLGAARERLRARRPRSTAGGRPTCPR